MASLDDALRALGDLLDAKEDRQVFRLALAGDGSGAADTGVSGRPGWSWVRYSEDPSKVSMVRNVRRRGVEAETLLVVGKEFSDDEYEQVLDIDLSVYWDTLTEHEAASMAVGRHGDAHNAATGNDPAPIDLRNILEGRGRATDPASLWVYVEPFRYIADGIRRWAGGNIDLTTHVPAGANEHCYAIVYLDTGTAALATVAGAAVVAPAIPAIPVVPDGAYPICIVDLSNGDTTIQDGSNLYDYRVAWLPTSGTFVEDYRLVTELALMEETYQRQTDELMGLVQALIHEVLNVDMELARTVDEAMGLVQGLIHEVLDIDAELARTIDDHVNGD